MRELFRDRALLEVKKERKVKERGLRETLTRDDEVEDEEEVDSAWERRETCDGMAADEAAAASSSLECRLSARRRRELWGLRRRESRVIVKLLECITARSFGSKVYGARWYDITK